MAQTQYEGWTRVSHDQPCPICGKSDWCSIGQKWILCKRVESRHPCKEGWLHLRPEVAWSLPLPLPRKVPPISDAELSAKWTPVIQASHHNGMVLLGVLADTLDVTTDSLIRLRVGFARMPMPCWTFPERNADGLYVGLVRRLLEPMSDGRNKLFTKGARRGLTYCDQWFDAPGPVYLVEGGSDVAAMLSLGLCAVGRPNNRGGAEMLVKLLQPHLPRTIVVVGERDRKSLANATPPHDPACTCCGRCAPGLWGARELAKSLSRQLGITVRTILPKAPHKDMRAWIASQDRAKWPAMAELLRRT